MFFTSKFYPWFPSFPSLFSLLCCFLDIQRKWEYLVSVLFYSDSIFLLFSSVPVEEKKSLPLFTVQDPFSLFYFSGLLPVRLAGSSQRWGKEEGQGAEVCPHSKAHFSPWVLCVTPDPAVSPGECAAGAVLHGLPLFLVLAFPVCFPSNNSSNRALYLVQHRALIKFWGWFQA